MDGIHNSFTFDELINEMIADAWYMVTEYHLRLGPLGITDNLEEVVKYIHANYSFRSSQKREDILAFLNSTDDKQIAKHKADLTLNVPYRLQVPFYDEITIGKLLWLGSRIEVDSIWVDYLIKHKEILKGWTQLKLVQYLQNKNPSVPGIADKIEAPAARDIERVRRYWRLIIELDPSLKDIYGEITLVEKSISVDHFVPLSELEYRAYELKAKEEAFRQRLANVIKPVYDSAKNQVFKEWTYHECNHL